MCDGLNAATALVANGKAIWRMARDGSAVREQKL
jgi:hypothetical protein